MMIFLVIDQKLIESRYTTILYGATLSNLAVCRVPS